MEKKKYRKISTHIWNDERFRELSNDAKFIFLFILTHPTTTSLGALRGNVPGLAFELGMELEAFQKAFEEVLNKGMAEYDPKAGFLWFPNFLKHNVPESPNVIKGWAAGFKNLPECAAKEELKYNAKALICCLSEGFQKAFAEAFGEPCTKTIANQGAGSREQGTGRKAEENTSPAGDVGASADKVDGPKIPNCPHEAISEAYNRTLPMLPQVKMLTDSRKNTLRAAWKANKARQSLDWWEAYFKLVLQCPFLLGQKNDFKAGFDWLLKPGNMVKVLEGNFREESQPPAINGGANQSPYDGVKPNTVAQAGLLQRDKAARQILAKRATEQGEDNGPTINV
ncbi:hypothetical protein [Desulfovibrio sp. UCD-KL4C]|uniref:hypothetical protein n=1 Tax=Desulfovibrio sp. UCD-KL4C TaxID=2578120 RepID=UPI0025BF1AC4|nr:hypothetical protein [Desulfovibrio sp. UCD-KL4C]